MFLFNFTPAAYFEPCANCAAGAIRGIEVLLQRFRGWLGIEVLFYHVSTIVAEARLWNVSDMEIEAPFTSPSASNCVGLFK
jgi:hypothetical protein